MIFDDITHIVFDLDGLLVDTEPLWAEAENIVLQKYGAVWDEAIAKTHTGIRMDEVAEIMVAAYGLEIDAPTLEQEVLDELFTMVKAQSILLPNADTLIEQTYAAGFILSIASSSREDYIRTIVDRFAWGDKISVIASAYNVPNGKPAPDVYLQAIDLLGAEPHQCLAFEDSVNGAKAAQAAGLRGVAIPGHGFAATEFEGIADYVLPTIAEVLERLPH